MFTRYKVTGAKPRGRMYHGPGHARSKWGLSLYHIGNSIRGIRTADAHGYSQIDNDFMMTKDGVIVCNHSFGAMEKEKFSAPGVPNRGIDRLTWAQVKQLRTPDGYPIQRIETMFKHYAKHNIWVAFELKGARFEGWRMCKPDTLDYIVALANKHEVKIFMKASRTHLQYRNALKRARNRGLWTRYNGGVFMAPTQ